MAINLDNLRKLRSYLDALIVASEVLAEPEPKAVEAVPVDLEAWKLSKRNRILAGSGDKAEILGTLSTPPTVDDKALAAVGADPEVSKAIITARDSFRADALALTAFAVEAPEKVAEVNR